MYKRAILLSAVAASLFTAPALAQMQKMKGIIVASGNGQLLLKTPAGDQKLVLPSDARVRSVSGPLGGQKDTVPQTALIPGLPISVDVDSSTGQMIARDIEYKAKDFQTAAQIQAGTEQMRNAYAKLGQWDIRVEENIYFKSGSAVIAPADKQKLLALADQAAGMNGYVISVLGYADPSGNKAANQQLSNRRAQNVINLLKQSGKVLPGRVLGASAMGQMNIPVTNPNSVSMEEARRVTVRVLTSAALLPQQ